MYLTVLDSGNKAVVRETINRKCPREGLKWKTTELLQYCKSVFCPRIRVNY